MNWVVTALMAESAHAGQVVTQSPPEARGVVLARVTDSWPPMGAMRLSGWSNQWSEVAPLLPGQRILVMVDGPVARGGRLYLSTEPGYASRLPSRFPVGWALEDAVSRGAIVEAVADVRSPTDE